MKFEDLYWRDVKSEPPVKPINSNLKFIKCLVILNMVSNNSSVKAEFNRRFINSDKNNYQSTAIYDFISKVWDINSVSLGSQLEVSHWMPLPDFGYNWVIGGEGESGFWKKNKTLNDIKTFRKIFLSFSINIEDAILKVNFKTNKKVDSIESKGKLNKKLLNLKDALLKIKLIPYDIQNVEEKDLVLHEYEKIINKELENNNLIIKIKNLNGIINNINSERHLDLEIDAFFDTSEFVKRLNILY